MWSTLIRWSQSTRQSLSAHPSFRFSREILKFDTRRPIHCGKLIVIAEEEMKKLHATYTEMTATMLVENGFGMESFLLFQFRF